MRQTCEGGREAQVEREMEKNGELTKKYTKSVLCHTQHLFHHHMRLQPPVLVDFTPSHTLQEVHSALPLCSALSGPPCWSHHVSGAQSVFVAGFVFVRCCLCCPVCLLLLVATLCITSAEARTIHTGLNF